MGNCIHPHCECLDYCEARDPHTKDPDQTCLLDALKKQGWELVRYGAWFTADGKNRDRYIFMKDPAGQVRGNLESKMVLPLGC